MLVNDPAAATPRQGFLIEYVDGRLRTDLYQGASADVRRLYMHLVQAATGFDTDAPASVSPLSPPPTAAALSSSMVPLTTTSTAAPGRQECVSAGGMEWLSDAIRDWRIAGPHTFQDHTWIYAYRSSFRVFRELVGNVRRDIVNDDGEIERGKLDIRLCELTPEHMRQFRDLLERLPQRQGQRDDGVEALDLILEADDKAKAVKKLGETGRPRQSKPNVLKKMEHLKPAIQYMFKNGWISEAAHVKFGLEWKKASTEKSKWRAKSKDVKPGAVRLLDEELQRTFESAAYLEGAATCDWMYWIPPILLTSGGRVAEVSGLHTDDIVYVLGIPCFRFIWDCPDEDDDEEDGQLGKVTRTAKTEDEFLRRLKNSASRRTIPIHPELLRLGFLEWVERRKAEVGPKPGPLFKELTWEEKSGYGRKPSEYILGLLKTAGVWRKRKKVCHSLRATCIQELRRVAMPKDERQRYIGHSTISQEQASYSETDQGPSCPAEEVLKYLKKTKFGVKFPAYAEVRELQVQRATTVQLGRKNSAARRRLEAAAEQ
jgi:integrase